MAIRMAENKNADEGKSLCNHVIDVNAISKYNEFSFDKFEIIYQYGYDAVVEYIKAHPELNLKK